MKLCFYISSCIDIDSSAPLTYTPTRSCFSTAERYRQTIATINTIFCLSPSATVYVVDASEQYDLYAEQLPRLFPQCIFVPIRKWSTPEDYELIRRHPNKSLGETILLRNFLSAFEQDLRQYEVCCKLSGRYLLTGLYRDELFQDSTRIFFKAPLVFPWKPEWTYHQVDLRQEEGHQCLKQYCSVFYGYGTAHLSTFVHLYQGMSSLLKHPSMTSYDVETLLYYLTTEYQSQITTIPTQVLGWLGPTGQLMKY
jgi:hypothetical protein